MPTSRKRKKKTNKKKRHPNYRGVSPDARRRISQELKENGLNNVRIDSHLHEHKVSELLLDFLEEELATCKTQDHEKKLVLLGVLSWNIGNYEKEQREQRIQDVLKNLEEDKAFVKHLEPVMRGLINRKVEHYDKYKYAIMSYDISRTPEGGLYLSVASTKM